MKYLGIEFPIKNQPQLDPTRFLNEERKHPWGAME